MVWDSSVGRCECLSLDRLGNQEHGFAMPCRENCPRIHLYLCGIIPFAPEIWQNVPSILLIDEAEGMLAPLVVAVFGANLRRPLFYVYI